MKIPFTEWAILFAFHLRWKAKDGDRWHIQVWHPEKRGFLVSHRGLRPVLITQWLWPWEKS